MLLKSQPVHSIDRKEDIIGALSIDVKDHNEKLAEQG
jgi:hypothetical protein